MNTRYVRMKTLEELTGLKRTTLRNIAKKVGACRKLGSAQQSACLYDVSLIIRYIEGDFND